MFPGPIFAVELLTSGRRKRYFALRLLYAAVLFFTLWTSYQATYPYRRATLAQQANIAGSFFQAFSLVQIFAVLLVGPALAAGTIAVERERRTIEYLFATDLSNGEIVVGKLAARLLQLCYLTLVGLPVLALTMLMGGIAPDELWAVFLITASTMLLVTTLSMAVSVWSPRVRDAMGRIYVLLLALLLAPAVLRLFAGWLGIGSGVDAVLRVLIDANPVWGIIRLEQQRWMGAAVGVWEPVRTLVAIQVAVSLVSAALAVWAVRRVHLSSAGGSIRSRARPRIARARRPVGNHPMLWKELFARSARLRLGIVGRVAVAVLLIAVLSPLLVAIAWQPDGRAFAATNVGVTVAIACFSLLGVAAMAATSITGEKEKDTWSTLLSTPLEGGEILRAKLAGVLYTARWPLALVGVLWLGTAGLYPPVLVALPFQLAVFAVIGVFVATFGLRLSLTSRNSTRSLAATLAALVFLGGGYLFCCAPLFMFGGPDAQFFFAPVIPFLLAVPGIVTVGPARDVFEMLGPFVLGVAGYAVAAGVLLATMTPGFDRLASRGARRMPSGKPDVRW